MESPIPEISAGVLSDRQILAERESGNIVIYPFEPKNVGNCSVDVTLGDNYYRYSGGRAWGSEAYSESKDLTFLNPFSVPQVLNYWGAPQRALIVDDEETARSHHLSMGSHYIILHPSETILVHTREFIGAKRNITTMMKARSSLGRIGISISTGGWGDVGFYNRWVVALTNTTTVKMVLPMGERIAQIVFLRTGPTSRDYSATGQYQDTNEIDELVTRWNPSMMLPPIKK